MRSGFLGVAGATAAAAVLTYVLFGAAVGSLQGADQDAFTTFWYGALVVSLGIFLPLEQVVSRAATRGGVRGGDVVRPALVLVAVAVVGVLLVAPLLGDDAATRAWVTTALVVLAGVSALQYTLRGVALGRGRLGAYAGALVADAGVRAAAAVLVAVLLVRPPGALFAGCVVGSALLAHAGLLLALRRSRAPQASVAALQDFGDLGVAHSTAAVRPGPRTATGAVVALLGASLAAQLLLNTGPLVVEAVTEADGAVAAYGAAFTLARAPLFVVVPVQAVLVPPMVRMVADGRVHELRVRMAQAAAAVAVLAGVGAGAGALLSRPAMAVLTGGTLQVPPGLTALLVAGTLVHAGLVVGTQALVATGRERWVLACWLTGLGVGALCLAALLAGGAGVEWAAAGGFSAGSAVAWLLSVGVLAHRAPAAVGAGR